MQRKFNFNIAVFTYKILLDNRLVHIFIIENEILRMFPVIARD